MTYQAGLLITAHMRQTARNQKPKSAQGNVDGREWRDGVASSRTRPRHRPHRMSTQGWGEGARGAMGTRGSRGCQHRDGGRVLGVVWKGTRGSVEGY